MTEATLTTPQALPLRRPTDFIEDGYTESHTIAETEEHGRLTFEFRPLGADEWARIVDASPSMAAYYSAGADVLAAAVTSWSMVTSKGAPVKITRANLLRIYRGLLSKMIDRCIETKPAATEADLKN
jgi:hypothetical protein